MRQTKLSRIKKTYMLSTEAVSVIEREKQARELRSASSALDALLKEMIPKRQSGGIAASISKYYDSLSKEEMKENRLWGAFAESQFPSQ